MGQNKLRIETGGIDLECTLNETKTSLKLLNLLPISATASKWGDEIYFPIPLEVELEEGGSDVVESGDIAYWPPGNAFCIFFGKIPASTNDEIRATSPVIPLGTVNGDEKVFQSIRSGENITISRR